MHCRTGIVTNSEFVTIPDQRRTASRCTASGKRSYVSAYATFTVLQNGE